MAIWVLSNQNGIREACVSLLLQPYLTYGFRMQGQNETWDVFYISGRDINKGLSSQRVLCNLRAAKSLGTQVLVWDSSFWYKSIMHHGLPGIIKLCMGSIQALQLLHERQCYYCYAVICIAWIKNTGKYTMQLESFGIILKQGIYSNRWDFCYRVYFC